MGRRNQQAEDKRGLHAETQRVKRDTWIGWRNHERRMGR